MAASNQSRLTRSSAMVGGMLLIAASVPLFFLAVLLGSGGDMTAFESAADHARLVALVSFPLLICATGGALLWGSRTGRYQLSVILALLMPVEVVAIVATFWLLDRREPPVIIPPADPHTVIPATTLNAPQAAPAPAVILRQSAAAPGCPRKTHRCDVPTIVALETSNASRPTSPARP